MAILTPARRLAAFAVSLLLLTGCVKSKDTTTVNKDGSGTFKMSLELDLAKFQAMKEMFEGMGASTGEENPMEEVKEENIRKVLEGKEGVKLVSVKTEEDKENQKLRHSLELTFDSLEHLFKSGVVQGMNVKLEKGEDGSYVLTRVLGGDDAPIGEEADAQMEMFMPMVEEFLKDMEMTSTITLPGAIVETSGTKEGDSTVTFSMKFKDLAKSALRVHTVKFAGEGLTLSPFSVTSEDMKSAKGEPEGKEGSDDDGEGNGDDDEGGDDDGMGGGR